MTSPFLEALGAFCVFVVLHAVGARIFGAKGLIATAARIWLAVALGAHLLYWREGASHALLALGFSFSFFGFHVLVLVAARNSVTLRMMDEIDRAGGLTTGQLEARFSDGESVSARLATMERNGIMIREGSSLRLSAKGQRIGRFALLVRSIFSVESAG